MAINDIAGGQVLRKFLSHDLESGFHTLKPKNLKKNLKKLKTFISKNLVFFSPGPWVWTVTIYRLGCDRSSAEESSRKRFCSDSLTMGHGTS